MIQLIIKTLFILQGVTVGTYLSKVVIDSENLNLKWERGGSSGEIYATSVDRNFTWRNETWPYKVAKYNLNTTTSKIFEFGSQVIVKGTNAVVINANGSLLVNTTIDVSAVALANLTGTSHLGGFALAAKNCCYVGAGPGAGFTFHGGGHGGIGGGSWVDQSNGVKYGKGYPAFGQVVGGSSGALVYDSDPGSGGGAILFDVKGTMTIGSKGRILANGYSVKNTSYPACSGGSAGGRIVLKAHQVVVDGELSADGGHAGMTSNYSDYCGDGGGGGIIDIRSYESHIPNQSAIHYKGGRGLENGTDGLFRSISILSGAPLEIDTTECEMQLLGEGYKKAGTLTHQLKKIDCDQWNLTTCAFVFENTVRFDPSVITIKGKNALKIVAKNGDIDIRTAIDLSMKGKTIPTSAGTILGGYNNFKSGNPGPGSYTEKGAHGNINDTRSYGIWPVLLMGGSSCTNQSLALAYGGGALELQAKKGEILVNANISADAYTASPDTSCGASGGTIILDAINVTLNAFVTANGCDGVAGGDGGVIHAPVDNGKTLVVPGNGHGLSKGKKGTLLSAEPATNPPPRSCQLTTSSATPPVTSNLIEMSSLSFTSEASKYYKKSFITTASSFFMGITASDAQTITFSHNSNWHVTPTPSSTFQAMHSSISIKDKDTVSERFKPFVGVQVNSSSAENISIDLATAVESSSLLTPRDTIVFMDIVRQLSNSSIYRPNDAREGKRVTKNIVRSCSKVAKMAFRSERKDNITTNLVPNIARTLEDLGESISMILETNETFLVQDDTIAIEVTAIDTNSLSERSFPVSKLGNDKEDNITIPREVFASVPGNVSVILVLMNINATYNQSTDVDGTKVQAVSNIVSIRLTSGKLNSLVKPIILRSRLLKKPSEGQTIKGGFWKARSKDSKGGWSYDGCTTESKGGYVEIKSSFAVLLTVTKEKIPDHHNEALKLISYIGCGISLFGLLMTFATFVTLDNLDPERTAIHTNLVVALGIAQIVFLSGINATHNKAACTTVAVLLHYFFTAAFSWMFAEGIHLYKKVVSVFSHGSKLKFYYLIGWGLPVIIVALSAGIRPDGYGTETACWISIEAGLIWAFVAPVTIVIIINFIILIVVVKILISSVSTVQVDSKTSQETNKSVQQIKAGAKAMVILMPILGLSWVFGILAVNEATLVFQYLFCIFNSLQGLFIFIIHVIGNSEVRAAFRRLHEKHTLTRSVGERSVGAKSTAKKSKSNSPGAEILVHREHGSSPDSHDGERTVTPKTLSAGQISLNSLNCPTPTEDYAKFE